MNELPTTSIHLVQGSGLTLTIQVQQNEPDDPNLKEIVANLMVDNQKLQKELETTRLLLWLERRFRANK